MFTANDDVICLQNLWCQEGDNQVSRSGNISMTCLCHKHDRLFTLQIT